MNDQLKTSFTQISNTLNKYADSGDLTYIEEIENNLKKLFSVEYVRFWKYDRNNESIALLDKEDNTLQLESSLTKQTIENQSVTLINHITSEKYYSPKIDNPLELKIRSLIIFPIMHDKKVYGIVKLGRGLKQKKVFTKQHEVMLEALSVLFQKIMLSEQMNKEELIGYTGDDIKKIPSATIKKNENLSAKKKLSESGNEKQVSSKELKALIEEKKALEKKLQHFKEQETELTTQISKFQNKLKEIDEKYTTLEASTSEIDGQLKEYQTRIKEFETEVESLKNENKTLRSIDDKESTSIQKLKSGMSLINSKNKINIDHNIECILQNIDDTFADNEYAYMLFELIIYALNSKKGLAQIEEIVKASKLLPKIINDYSFNTDMDIHNEKHIFSKFVNNIEKYEKKIFLGAPKITIITDEKIPTSLVFDRPKLQSILYHLLIDLYQFTDHTRDLSINIKYDNNFLYIQVGGFTHNQNTLLKSMFKKTKLSSDEKDRLGLQLSRKLMKRLKGNLEITYKEEYYQFLLTLPVQILKI